MAQDGTVTATDDQWNQAQQKAAEILAEWNATPQRQKKDAAFSQLAVTWSQDNASRDNGGCYYGLLPGMLAEPLNEWCFSDQREAGDYVVLRSDYGEQKVAVLDYCGRFRDNHFAVGAFYTRDDEVAVDDVMNLED